MPRIVIYTASLCPFCHMAKMLLRRKGVPFEEVNITGQEKLRAEMRAKSGGRSTIPQIWVDGVHIGGCNDLRRLDRAGKLDQLLAT